VRSRQHALIPRAQQRQRFPGQSRVTLDFNLKRKLREQQTENTHRAIENGK
jgi:hypothetical protein